MKALFLFITPFLTVKKKSEKTTIIDCHLGLSVYI